MQAVKKKDKDKLLLTSNVMSMDYDLKVQFLKKYLHQCKLKHKMAFAQWRDKYCHYSDVSSLAC